MSGLLIAQESVTSATVKWIIVALLVVAALLTMLTVWYWRHTDPRQRMAAARRAPVDRAPAPSRPTAPRSAAPDGQYVAGDDGWTQSRTPSASDAVAEARRRAPSGGSPSPSSMSAPTSPPRSPSNDDLEADDWLRLTGPQALPRDGS